MSKQNKQPTPENPTAPLKATAGLLLSAGAAVVVAATHNSNGEQSQASGIPNHEPKASVDYIIKAPDPGSSKTFKGPEGKNYTWADPATPREDIRIIEDGKGGLKAKTEFGNSVSFDLHLPAPGTETKGEVPQQDPAEKIEFTPPNTLAFVNSGEVNGKLMRFADYGEGQPITIEEDGKGGLVAENEAGNPVEMDIHLPVSKAQNYNPSTDKPHGPYDKNANLTPKPSDLVGVPGGKNPTDGEAAHHPLPSFDSGIGPDGRLDMLAHKIVQSSDGTHWVENRDYHDHRVDGGTSAPAPEHPQK